MEMDVCEMFGNQKKFLPYFIIFLSINISSSLSQCKSNNPTTWPFGGEPDSNRAKTWLDYIPINFNQTRFYDVLFPNNAFF